MFNDMFKYISEKPGTEQFNIRWILCMFFSESRILTIIFSSRNDSIYCTHRLLSHWKLTAFVLSEIKYVNSLYLFMTELFLISKMPIQQWKTDSMLHFCWISRTLVSIIPIFFSGDRIYIVVLQMVPCRCWETIWSVYWMEVILFRILQNAIG